jgi:peptidyl-prolyl cis-trans isomerase C
MKILKGLPFAALVLLAACNKATTTPGDTATAKPEDKPVAVVNGEPIGRGTFEFYVKNATGKPLSELTAEQRTQALDNLVRGELIAQEAAKEGLDKTGDVPSQLALSRLSILQQAGAMHFLDDKKPSDADLKAEYDAQVAQMPRMQYRARHILLKTQGDAQKMIDQLKKGAKFEDLAKKNSMDSSKEQGGDLGFFSPASMVPPFAAAVEGLKKGEYTQTPVQTQYGWHVIKLEDTRETPVPPFDQVKDRVSQLVEQKKFRAHEDDLLKAAKVEKFIDEGSSSGGMGMAPAMAPAAPATPAKP